jgi:hypothetical protein
MYSVNQPMKYAALTLSTLATVLLALALVGMANRIGSGGRPLPPVRNALAPLSAQQMGDQVDVQLALQSLGKLPSTRFFASPAASGATDHAGAPAESMSAFDGDIFALSPQRTETPDSPRSRTGTIQMPPRPLPLPRVTVVMESGASGKAVVNGQLVRVGDAVGDGMVVSSINVDAVTFASGKEVLEVRMPLDRLRVLGAFPGSSKGN